jgi:hypothetical protein
MIEAFAVHRLRVGPAAGFDSILDPARSLRLFTEVMLYNE